MSYCGSWKIDDYLTFCCNPHDPDTGVATDADSVPTYRVYEDETTTPILTGSMALLDGANTVGFYSERIQLTAANGFEKGKCYTVYITATVDSDTGTMHHGFQIEAEVDCNTASDLHADLDDGGRLDLLIDAIKTVTDNLPNSGALSDLATILTDTNELQTDDVPGLISGLNDPTSAVIADAVWDEAAAGHVAAGSFGAQAGTDIDAILTDTGELQPDWHDGGRLDLLIDAITVHLTDVKGTGFVKDTDSLVDLAHTGADSDTLETLSDQVDTITAAAIADAVLDEALASHNTEDTLGNVINDLVEEEDGTYRLTSAALQSTLGAGATEFTYTLTSSVDSTPVADADIWVTTSNDPDDNVIASGTTDANGEVTFYLDAGTIYVWRQKSGWDFTNPDIEVVS